MAHEVVPAAEEILDREFPVLDHGFVRLVDYLGGDQRIVQSARVSYGSGTKSYRQDKGLIDYLLRNEHTSPFEQVVLTFHTKMPVFVARQWVRHRTARLNEISGRYSVMKDEFYLPAGDAIAPQAQDNKQGRSGEPFDEATREEIQIELAEQQGAAYRGYESLLERDLARELARINLPLSMYTEWYWQIDLHNLFHFLKLRMDGHAQYEIRAYAEVMFEIARAVCPLAVESFEEHLRGSVRLSRSEFAALQRLLGVGDAASESSATAAPEDTPAASTAPATSRAATEERIRAAAKEAGIDGRAADRLVAKILDGKMG
jgi:thymidylate synthase (FAD)